MVVLLHQEMLLRRIRRHLLLQEARWIATAFLGLGFGKLLCGWRHLLLLAQIHRWPVADELLRLGGEPWILRSGLLLDAAASLVQNLALILSRNWQVYQGRRLVLRHHLRARSKRLWVLIAQLALHLCVALLLRLHIVC